MFSFHIIFFQYFNSNLKWQVPFYQYFFFFVVLVCSFRLIDWIIINKIIKKKINRWINKDAYKYVCMFTCCVLKPIYFSCLFLFIFFCLIINYPIYSLLTLSLSFFYSLCLEGSEQQFKQTLIVVWVDDSINICICIYIYLIETSWYGMGVVVVVIYWCLSFYIHSRRVYTHTYILTRPTTNVFFCFCCHFGCNRRRHQHRVCALVSKLSFFFY